MKKLLLFGFILSLSSVANAEFGAQEKAEVITQLKALGDVQLSVYWALQHAAIDPSAADEVATYMTNVIPQWEAHFGGLMYLLDLPGEFTEATWRAVLAGPRADVVVLALSKIKTNGYSFAKTKLDAVPGTSTALTNAKNLLASATAARLAIDDTLAYTEPRTALNLATPGTTREKSAAIGPHGDYRMMGAAMYRAMNSMRTVGLGMASAVTACPGWVGQSKGAGFAYSSVHLITKFIPIVAALTAGIEPDIRPPLDNDGAGYNIIEHIDVMTAGGTTTRPRDFFRVQFAIELLLMLDHTGPEPYDINGRHTVRGLTYNFSVLGQVWQIAIDDRSTVCAPAGEAAFLSGIADAVVANDAAWGRMDSIVQHGLFILKHFQVFPAPGPIGGGSGLTCGVGTHEENGVCVADPCPACPPEVTCGAGTHSVGTECVADIVTCPTPVPELEVLSDRILAKCAVAP